MSITPQRLAFRPARNVKELESLFRLRYQGYLESQCASLVTDNQHGFELDVYDHYAHHIGLFQEGRFGSHPIGCLRLVQEHRTPFSDLVDAIAKNYNIPCRLPQEGPGLPLLHNCPEKEAIGEHMNLLRPEHNGIVEASRFVFAPEARSGGYTKFFVEAAIARMLYHHRFSGIMLACHPRHAALYRRYGFKQIVDGNQNDYNGLAASILSLRIPDIRPALQSKIQSMGLAQQRHGGLLLHPETKAWGAPIPAVKKRLVA
jgi:N-acyl-L-homoserine lactone synthetase